MPDPEGVVATYEVVTSGSPSPLVRAAFPGFDLQTIDHGRIRMIGTVRDVAELLGVLHTLQDLGLPIVDVHRIEGD